MTRGRPTLSVCDVPPSHPQVKVALLAHELLGSLVALVLRHVDAECRSVSSHADVLALASWTPDILVADLDRYEKAPEWARIDGHSLPSLGLTRRRETAAKLEA